MPAPANGALSFPAKKHARALASSVKVKQEPSPSDEAPTTGQTSCQKDLQPCRVTGLAAGRVPDDIPGMWRISEALDHLRTQEAAGGGGEAGGEGGGLAKLIALHGAPSFYKVLLLFCITIQVWVSRGDKLFSS